MVRLLLYVCKSSGLFLFHGIDYYYYVKEENLFLSFTDAFKVLDFHFNFEFVLFGVFGNLFQLGFHYWMFEFEVP